MLILVFAGMFQIRLPPEVNRILYIRNLPYKITAEEMYDIFGKYGPIRQIRVWVSGYSLTHLYTIIHWRTEVLIMCINHVSFCKLTEINWVFSDCFSGNTPESRGTAYVVYEDIFDAKNACDHLSGFNVCNRYLVVLYYNPNRVSLTVFAFELYGMWNKNVFLMFHCMLKN